MADEKSIEDTYYEWLDKHKLGIGLKLYLAALMGWPDRTVFLRGGKILFIEFKDGDNVLSPQQIYWRNILINLGFHWFECRSLSDAQNVTRVVMNL